MARARQPGRTNPRWTAWVLAVVLLGLGLPTPTRASGEHAVRPAPPVAECGADVDTLLPSLPDPPADPATTASPMASSPDALPREPADGPGAFHFIAAGRDAWSTTLPPSLHPLAPRAGDTRPGHATGMRDRDTRPGCATGTRDRDARPGHAAGPACRSEPAPGH